MLLLASHSPSTIPAAVPLRYVTACSAATKAEIEEALGHALTNGKEQKAGNGSICQYDGNGGQVTILLQHATDKLDVEAEIRNLQATFPDATMREAPGIGKRAVFLDMPDIGTQLHVIRGDYDYVMVSVLGFGDASQVGPAAEKIARHILIR
jgi:hypothetical protein